MVELVIVKKEDDGSRLDRWIVRYYPNVPFAVIQKEIRKKGIRINNKRAENNAIINYGDEIRIPFNEMEKRKIKPQNQKLDVEILFENKDLIIINKPAGIPVQGGTGVKLSIDNVFPDYKLVHRLDKDTSGVLILAKNVKTAAKMMEYFKQKQILKTYLAVVVGVPLKKEGVINTKLMFSGEKVLVSKTEGQAAETHYKILDSLDDKLALVEVNPKTGRKHQIRAHMNYLGCPILGDGKYGGKAAFITKNKEKLHLHAIKCKIIPENIEAKALIPEHFKNTLDFYGLLYQNNSLK